VSEPLIHTSRDFKALVRILATLGADELLAK